MYSVMLVDDEKWIVQSIKSKGNWQKHGLGIVEVAYNGLDALEKIESCRPDAVFTDIRMPGMNGLDMMAKIKEKGWGTEFVVISGYTDFDYVKQALKLGALDYMLKSVDEEEMDGVLARLSTKLNDAKRLSGQQLSALLHGGLAENKQAVEEILVRNGLPGQADELAVLCVIGSEDFPVPSGLAYLELKVASRIRAFLVSSKDQSSWLAHWTDQAIDCDGIGIGKQARELTGLEAGIQTAALAAGRFFLTGRRGEIHAYRKGSDIAGEWQSRLYDALRNRLPQEAANAFSQLRTFLKEDSSDVRQAIRMHAFVQSFVHREEEDELNELSLSAILSSYANVDRMIDELEKTVAAALEDRIDPSGAGIEHEAMKRIVAYIETEYAQNLSLQTIAMKFNLHPNYISQLFQRELHTTFTKRLLSVRLEHACGMLFNTGLSINEIADKVGFSDYFYFAKVFKKQTGMTPTQYRSEGRRSHLA